ncbi:hypothetical protein BCV70DRAFT_157162 [Testicularia cyperi]|uniref:PIN domain-containing protein n=1 Tax=Testicularia cyperi TaxID=1882483 RepID=A0A317XUU8_9BASI|nr:hypothetical protein BCV70DRAFT_157162 [Testicularia cyperi]
MSPSPGAQASRKTPHDALDATPNATSVARPGASANRNNDALPAVTSKKQQHHVSFQVQEDDAVLVAQHLGRRRGRGNRGNSHPRSKCNDGKDTEPESSSSKSVSTSRTSSRQSRRDQSEAESLKSAVLESSAGSHTNRSRRRHRQQGEKKIERASATRPDLGAKNATEEDSATTHTNGTASASTSANNSSSYNTRREPKSRESSVPGKRNRQHSSHGPLSDIRSLDAAKSEVSLRSHQTSSGTGSGAPGPRRDRFSRTNEVRHSHGETITVRDGRQLFDPRRDDPVKFCSQQRSQNDERARSSLAVPSRVLNSSAPGTPHILMRRDPASSGSGSGANSRSPTFGASHSADPSLASSRLDLEDPKILQAHVVEIKRLYRMISQMEASLQEAHRKEAQREREAMGDPTPPEQLDPTYWIVTIMRHRDLAECHSSFLEMTCRPELPRSVQELAEVYNLPSRLWSTGFHLMLESLRHNLSLSIHPPHGIRRRRAELLDHLTEFIYYAYSFYSALHETERYSAFRRGWIESLGDLSRYRMAVAGLAASMSIDGGGEEIRNKSIGKRNAATARIDDDDDDDDDEEEEDDDGDNADGRSNDPSDLFELDQVEKASIGSAALGDWEWTEKETWRQTAKDWYAKGIAEYPVTGRLHHHLGVLTRDDELRALHHLTKSLVTAKPYGNAKESILTMFDQQHQSLRYRPDSSVEELFVYLHGILITRVQLDDFEPVCAELLAKIRRSVEDKGTRCLPQSVWMMMACINIAALLQYGSDDSVLVDLLLQDSGKAGRRPQRTDKGKGATPRAILVNQTVKSEDNFLSELPRDAEWDDFSEDESEPGDEGQMIQIEHRTVPDETESMTELPVSLSRAAELCFDILTLSFRSVDTDDEGRTNPYVTLMTTFVLSLCQSKRACRLVERFVPWDLWLQHVERSVSLVERDWPKVLHAPFITSRLLLPEDWCLRGLVGLSRHLFDRSVLRPSASGSPVSCPLSQAFANETEVLDCDDDELYGRMAAAGSGVPAAPSNSSTSDAKARAVPIDMLRVFRIAHAARRLAKSGKAFELDSKSSRLSLSQFLLARITKLRMKEEQRQLEDRIAELRLQAAAVAHVQADTDTESVESSRDQEARLDYDDDVDSTLLSDTEVNQPSRTAPFGSLKELDSASDEIRALQERRSYLKKVLHSLAAKLRCARNANQHLTSAGASPFSPGHNDTAIQLETVDVLPGYTVLVIDTNLIVTPGELVQKLVESQHWTVIIPLAVITELDGLRRNDNALGQEAERAIQFLETHIRASAKRLKVQTSRGNYLTDLSIRSEDIDFGWQAAGSSGGTTSSARKHGVDSSNSKSFAARNVDEVILRILAWQTEHFVDRRSQVLHRELEAAPTSQASASVHKVVLLSLDRNLRLKAKTRGLGSLDEKGIACLLGMTKVPSAGANNQT